jgi:multidrug efflux pump subunit AcrA (membrane-fusion protein)
MFSLPRSTGRTAHGRPLCAEWRSIREIGAAAKARQQRAKRNSSARAQEGELREQMRVATAALAAARAELEQARQARDAALDPRRALERRAVRALDGVLARQQLRAKLGAQRLRQARHAARHGQRDELEGVVAARVGAPAPAAAPSPRIVPLFADRPAMTTRAPGRWQGNTFAGVVHAPEAPSQAPGRLAQQFLDNPPVDGPMLSNRAFEALPGYETDAFSADRDFIRASALPVKAER